MLRDSLLQRVAVVFKLPAAQLNFDELAKPGGLHQNRRLHDGAMLSILKASTGRDGSLEKRFAGSRGSGLTIAKSSQRRSRLAFELSGPTTQVVEQDRK